MTWTIIGWLFAGYAMITGIYIMLENRRPQGTLAWMLLFLGLPGLGLVIYLLFGRNWKAFSRDSQLARQNLQANAAPLLGSLQEEQDREIAKLERQGPVRHRLMRLVRRNSHSALTTNNIVAIQQDAAMFYPSLIADLQSARYAIHLQFYIWADDPFTQELKTLLIDAVKRGVEVRILYDPIGSGQKLTRRYKREMTEAGIHMVPASALWRLHTLSYRNHRKIAVIDGRIGYTGGMNIGQEHLDGGGAFKSWRDTQVRIDGDCATVLQVVFMIDWYNATGEDLFAKERFPLLRRQVEDAAVETNARKQAQPDMSRVPVQLLTSGPDSEWRAIRQLYFAMIVSAQRRVVLQSPFFILDATIAEALKSTALSGVQVQVMVSARGEGANQAPYWAANTYMAEVAAAGVEVFLYEEGYLHAKTISIDGEVCSVGTANLDIRSFSINYEINAVIYDVALARELEAAFERDLKGCTRFDAAEYEERPILSRLRDSAARLLSPLL
jgi:cardiolipin synthase